MSAKEIQAYSAFRVLEGRSPLGEAAKVLCQWWGRLRLPTRQIARTAWKELQRHVDAPKRTAQMVKVRKPFPSDF